MTTLIDKINTFESGDENVANFNKVFKDCPLDMTLHKLTPDDYVSIGFPCSPETRREITVNGLKTLKHDFQPRLGEFPSATENDTSFKYEREEKAPVIRGSRSTKIVYNEDNTVMTKQEMTMKSSHYFVLQYLRGCTNDNHTQEEIAKNLNISIRGLRNLFKEMEEQKILSFSKTMKSNQNKTKITICENWR
jgi:hypothetical protein